MEKVSSFVILNPKICDQSGLTATEESFDKITAIKKNTGTGLKIKQID